MQNQTAAKASGTRTLRSSSIGSNSYLKAAMKRMLDESMSLTIMSTATLIKLVLQFYEKLCLNLANKYTAVRRSGSS